MWNSLWFFYGNQEMISEEANTSQSLNIIFGGV